MWYVFGTRTARDPRIVIGTTSAFDLVANIKPPPLKGLILPSRLVAPSGKIRMGVPVLIVSAAFRKDLTAACGFSQSIATWPDRRKCQPRNGYRNKSFFAAKRNWNGSAAKMIGMSMWL